MFDPTDPELITSLLATGDRKKLLYGLLNSISDSDPIRDVSSRWRRSSPFSRRNATAET